MKGSYSSKQARKDAMVARGKAARKAKTARAATSPYGGLSIRRSGFLKIRVKIEPASNQLTSTAAATGVYSWTFTANDLPDLTSYSSIYDSYRFDKITAVIIPATQIASPATTYQWAPLVTAIDYDDGALPSTYNEVLAYGTSMVHDPMGGMIMRSFTPRCAVGAIDTGASYANKVTKKWQWIDFASTAVSHYGFKAVVKQATSTNVFNYYIYFIYDISMKSTR